jgi:hypothetical protein
LSKSAATKIFDGEDLLMATDAEDTRENRQKRTLLDFDTPIQTATFDEALGLQATGAAVSSAADAAPAVERTNLVRSAAGPIEGEPVPDFETMADQIRAKYEFAIDFDYRTIHALADTRSFLIAARRWPVEFKALSRARGIKHGRLETMVIRWFRSEADIGRTNVNRWADALMWLVDHCPAESASAVVAAAEKVGGLTKIAAIWRAATNAKTRNAAALAEPPNVVAEADAIIAGLEPDRVEPIPADYQPPPEHDEENSVGVSLWRKRPGCPREYYEIRGDEKSIRRALKELRQWR